MRDTVCTLQQRDEILIAYLYDDLDPDDGQSFAAHLNQCAVCRTELSELRGVRGDLAEWTPPAPARVLTFQPMAARRARAWSALADIPAWTQVAAAVLVLGVAAAIANVDVRVDDRGWTVRTGWSTPAPVAEEPGAAAAAAGVTEAPWRSDLAALETSLRAELESASPAGQRAALAGDAVDNAALLRQVRALIAASESNQRRELALRVAEIARDVQLQRSVDLQRIQRSFTVFENQTGSAIVRQGQLLDRIATRVSQQQ